MIVAEVMINFSVEEMSLPKKYPIRININTQIPAPRLVNKQNLESFIFENPAGIDMN